MGAKVSAENPDKLATVVWEGDSLKVLRSFPKKVMRKFGADIFNLQRGERPKSFRPMPAVGKGVMELKQRDDAGWYRIIYLSRVEETLYMLHTFRKQSAKTSKKDIAVAQTRLKTVLEAIRKEKTDGKSSDNC